MINRLKHLWQRAFAHAGFKKYFKNTSWLFGGQMLRLVLGLFVSVAVARYLGPADFGLYNYVLSIVALLAVVAGLGLKTLAKRQLVEHPDQRDAILGTCFVLSLLSGLIIYAGMLLIVGYTTDSSLALGLFALLGGGILLLEPLKYIEIWFQSQVRSDLSVSATSVTLLIFAAVKVAAIYYGADLLAFGYIFCFEAISLVSLLIYFYGRHFGSFLRWQFNRAVAVDFLKQAWPLILSGLAITVYMKVDQIMLGAMLGDEAVGHYSAAVRISAVWYFIPTILATSLFPAIMHARAKSPELYQQRLQRYFDLNAGLAYLICIPLTFAAPWVVLFLFGADYHSAGPILAIHAWSSLFVFLGVARGQYLIAEKLFKFSLACTVAGAIVNVIMNYYLIPSYGGFGAACATLLSYGVSAFLSSAFLRNGDAILKRQLLALVTPRLLFKTQR